MTNVQKKRSKFLLEESTNSSNIVDFKRPLPTLLPRKTYETKSIPKVRRVQMKLKLNKIMGQLNNYLHYNIGIDFRCRLSLLRNQWWRRGIHRNVNILSLMPDCHHLQKIKLWLYFLSPRNSQDDINMCLFPRCYHERNIIHIVKKHNLQGLM